MASAICFSTAKNLNLSDNHGEGDVSKYFVIAETKAEEKALGKQSKKNRIVGILSNL